MSSTDQATLTETPDVDGAFPRLDDAQVQTLAAAGDRRPVHAGEVLYREGDGSCDFFVILGGMVAVVEDYGGPQEQLVAVHGPGRFLGELGVVTGQAVLFTAVVRD